MSSQKTMVGKVNADVLSFTVGKDAVLDRELVDADCIGTAAHVTMLQRLSVKPSLFSIKERDDVIAELVEIMRRGRKGQFKILASDQDVHLAVERTLTKKLGDVGKRIHTARSRNDQVAVDLRLYAKEELLGLLLDSVELSSVLLSFAKKHKMWPMVGRTHLQPAMPSTVGLWASAHAESLLDDISCLESAYQLNDRCPLGSAAGYGVPLAIDRELTSKLLNFAEPIHNVLYASNARGKCESVIVAALSQVMLSLSRLSEDMILYSMPEFAYFKLPAELCTGSSIMPQKKNPDVLELVRAKVARVLADSTAITGILKGLPGGYNRDLQEIKEPFMESMQTTRASVKIMIDMVKSLKADKKALHAAFTPEVFAADRALELVAEGASFRDSYNQVRDDLESLQVDDLGAAMLKRTHLGAGAGLDIDFLMKRSKEVGVKVKRTRVRYYAAISKLLGTKYSDLSI